MPVISIQYTFSPTAETYIHCYTLKYSDGLCPSQPALPTAVASFSFILPVADSGQPSWQRCQLAMAHCCSWLATCMNVMTFLF